MKALLKFLAWLAAVAVFLLATAHFTLRHALNTPKFKAAATGFIERATGRPADYDRIGYTLFPFSLVVRHAALKEPGGTRDFATMEAFSVHVDWRAREITSLTLARPVIRIVQRPDGTLNISDWLPAPDPRGRTGRARHPRRAAHRTLRARPGKGPVPPGGAAHGPAPGSDRAGAG